MSRALVARNATFAVAQVVLTGLLLLVTYWVMMQYLSVAEIGLWSLVIGSTMVARLFELGLGTGVLRFVAGDLGQECPESAARTVGMATIAVTVLVGALAMVLQPFLYDFLLGITPAELHSAIAALLPAALLGLVLGSASNVFVSALDGCQRFDLRAWLLVGSGGVQLAATWFVLPRWGLERLGEVTVIQSAFQLVVGAVMVAWLLRRPLRDYLGFDRARLKELAVFGGGYQLSVVVMMLFEPLLRVLLTTYSGLTLTGYFEMASRIAGRLCAVVASALSALTPHVAAGSLAGEARPEQVRGIFREVFSLQLFLQLPYFACLAAAMGLVLTLWKGQFDPAFLAVTLLQLWAWFFKLLSVPAYMIYLGTGRLRWNIASQVATGALLLALGIPLGELFGGAGVLAAGALALGGGAQISTWALLRENAIGPGELISARDLPGLIVLVIASAACAWLAARSGTPSWAVLLGLPTAVALASLVVALRDQRMTGLLAHLPLRKA